MSSTNPVPYIPLLEGYSGYVYLTNSTTVAGIVYATGANQSATQPLALQNNVIGFSKALGSGQGRLQIAYDSVSDTTQLQYIGGSPTSPFTWDPAMADNFPVSIALTDIAFISNSNQYDLYTFIPPASGANGPGSGGSQFTFDVWALCQPQVASISPTSIVADGATHVITVSLVRRLHSSQSPTFSPSITGSGVTLGAPTPITNANGQITGWSMTATAIAAQPSSMQSLVFAFTENATYLSGDTIVTQALTYPSSGWSFSIVSEVSSAIPIATTAATLVGGSGTDVIHGIVTATSSVIAGGLTAQITLTSGTLSDLTAPVNIVAMPANFVTGTSYSSPKLQSINNRTIVMAMEKVGAPTIVINAQQDNVYQQQYYANFDTSTLLLDPSGNAYPEWSIGYSATGPTVPYTNWFGSFYINGNLTGSTTAYTIYALVGGDEYSYSSGVWFDDKGNPATNLYFSGTVPFYISPNWNPKNVVNAAPEVVSLIQYQIDSGSFVTANLTTTYTNPVNGDIAMGLASIDTTQFSVPTGNHTIAWKLTTDLDPGASQTQVQTGSIAFSTDQSAIGGTIPDYTVSTTSATTQTFVQDGTSSVAWVLKYTPRFLFVGTLNFTVTGQPSGTTFIFAPTTLSLLPGGTALTTTLTATANGAPPSPGYNITIHAKSGMFDAPLNVLLAVEAVEIAPAPPYNDNGRGY